MEKYINEPKPRLDESNLKDTMTKKCLTELKFTFIYSKFKVKHI